MQNLRVDLVVKQGLALHHSILINSGNDENSFTVRQKKLALTYQLSLLDSSGHTQAKICQCISPIVPKYRICIEGDSKAYYFQQKFSLRPSYKITGLPWNIERGSGNQLAAVDANKGCTIFEMDWEVSHSEVRYVMRISEASQILHCICIAIAYIMAKEAISRTGRTNH